MTTKYKPVASRTQTIYVPEKKGSSLGSIFGWIFLILIVIGAFSGH